MEKTLISELILTIVLACIILINIIYEDRKIKKIRKRINMLEESSKNCENIFYSLINKK